MRARGWLQGCNMCCSEGAVWRAGQRVPQSLHSFAFLSLGAPGAGHTTHTTRQGSFAKGTCQRTFDHSDCDGPDAEVAKASKHAQERCKHARVAATEGKAAETKRRLLRQQCDHNTRVTTLARVTTRRNRTLMKTRGAQRQSCVRAKHFSVRPVCSALVRCLVFGAVRRFRVGRSSAKTQKAWGHDYRARGLRDSQSPEGNR